MGKRNEFEAIKTSMVVNVIIYWTPTLFFEFSSNLKEQDAKCHSDVEEAFWKEDIGFASEVQI